MPLNIPLIRRIQRHILAEPRRFDMYRWAAPSKTAPCGTSGCIAGWALMLRPRAPLGKKLPDLLKFMAGPGVYVPATDKELDACSWAVDDQIYRAIRDRAAKRLGLDNETLARQVFFAESWPEPFNGLYSSVDSDPTTRAAIAVARLEYLIATGQ